VKPKVEDAVLLTQQKNTRRSQCYADTAENSCELMCEQEKMIKTKRSSLDTDTISEERKTDTL